MDNVFIDTDIILDLIQKRDPFYQEALEIFSLAEENKIKAHVSPLIYSNLFYILRKAESRRFAIQILTQIKAIVTIVTIDEKIIELALSSDFKDFEDAIQYYAALDSNLDYLLTRNKSDYKETGILVCTAKEYLAIRLSKK
jgi:predicted nucleic acid-binding protein